MEEPQFPFFGAGDEHELQHCFDCGKPLPDEGDPDVILLALQDGNGVWQTVPACRRHWREARRAESGLM